MNALLHPTYFPNIAHCVGLVNADKITFEVADNYQKQTFRNRTYIYGANGQLTLNVPVKHSHKNRQRYKEVRIANEDQWQQLHWKSLLSAYKTSPFFEYYEDDLRPLFYENQDYIMEFNFKCMMVIMDCIGYDLNYNQTSLYEKEPQQTQDLRNLVNARKPVSLNFEPYTQVFGSKHGFLNNLSVLDLLFNEGPNSLNYLESQTLIL